MYFSISFKILMYLIIFSVPNIVLSFNDENSSNIANIPKVSSDKPLIKIGVLSKRSVPITIARWSGLASYLGERIDSHNFVIVPLSFDSVDTMVDKEKIDFLLANPGMFVNLSFKYKLFAIATLKRKILGKGYTDFGSVIFARSDSNSINHFQSLIDADIAAVSEHSFGGWIAALREMNDQNIDVDSFHSLSFLGSHDAVVQAIMNKTFDIGIVRTDTLERMAEEKLIDLNSIKIIKVTNLNEINFPFLISSRLYPEWPLASLSHMSSTIAEQVSAALLTMQSNSVAATQAKIIGWTVPKNYREIDHALSQLKLGYYKDIGNYSFMDVIEKYWKYMIAVLIIMVSIIVVGIYILSLNKKLKASEISLREKATHDPLTGLANRVLFYELARNYLFMATREKQISMVLFLDLDKFKLVNDTFGHDAGDKLLIDVAERLSDCLRSSDILARIGGDEFLIMLTNVASIPDFSLVMNRIVDSVARPFISENGDELNIGCSIGASHFPEQGDNLQRLIKQADIALYQAKADGRGRFINYQEENPHR
ncbi:MAG: hypothetical protein COA86_06665 [Kangiella sp.]|nr:MAG: hypothetical protein COA86_06665 [Kangiella sp.]